jgi:hypothetical protein
MKRTLEDFGFQVHNKKFKFEKYKSTIGKILTVQKKLSDAFMKEMNAHYFDENFFEIIISEDCDCYKDDGWIVIVQISKKSYS